MAEKTSVGVVETRYFTFAEPPNAMSLESGAALGPITLAYETYGVLNDDHSNAILVLHGLSGDAHAAGYHKDQEDNPGWWEDTIGPGKTFDTDRYFVICSNVIGGCKGSTGPSSINPASGEPYGSDFPVITIGDMVNAQKKLIDHLSIEKLLSIAGGSMGGMQALEWAVRHPDMMKSVILMACSHRHSAQHIAFHAVGRHAIQSDEAFAEGKYYDQDIPSSGLAIARMLAHITYLSDASMDNKFGRTLKSSGALKFQMDKEFNVETYLDYQGEKFVDRFDANTYLYVTKALDYFDLSESYGSLDDAMARVQAKVLILAYSSDWLYPPKASLEIVDALARHEKDVSYCTIRTDYGHDAFLLESEEVKPAIEGFLANVTAPRQLCASCIKTYEKEKIGPIEANKESIYRDRRADYDMIVDLVAPGSRVLDIGCGHGELLCLLNHKKDTFGVGMDLKQENVINGINCGISILQADIDKGLGGFHSQSFDYVLLSMTLQVIQHPDLALQEMLRVGKKCIVSFPNFGYWRVRSKAFFSGKAPVTRNLPYSWYQSPNRHVLTIKDFRNFCKELDIRIDQEYYLSKDGYASLMPNLLAEEALCILSR